MSRILLVDDSPHAQRMGERILAGEGYEVVTVSNADSALVRLDDVDPDVVIADTVMPGRSGYEICQYLKMSPRHKHVRVILTAGVLEPIDEAQALRVESDGALKKPFEATALIAAVKPLAEAAAKDRGAGTGRSGGQGSGAGGEGPGPAMPFVAVVDAEQVRAAVAIALDASMDAIVDEIARRVVTALQTKKPEVGKASESVVSGAAPDARPLAPDPQTGPRPEVRRVTSLRARGASSPVPNPQSPVPAAQPRSASILGLDAGAGEPQGPLPDPQPPAADSH